MLSSSNTALGHLLMSPPSGIYFSPKSPAQSWSSLPCRSLLCFLQGFLRRGKEVGTSLLFGNAEITECCQQLQSLGMGLQLSESVQRSSHVVLRLQGWMSISHSVLLRKQVYCKNPAPSKIFVAIGLDLLTQVTHKNQRFFSCPSHFFCKYIQNQTNKQEVII